MFLNALASISVDAEAGDDTGEGMGFAEGDGDALDAGVGGEGGINGKLRGTFDHLTLGINERGADGFGDGNVVNGVGEVIALSGGTEVAAEFEVEI